MKPLAIALSGFALAGLVPGTATPVAAEDPAGTLADKPMAAVAALPAGAMPLTAAQMDGLRGTGFLSAWLSGLLSGLPEQNTVAAQIGDNPPEVSSGDGPQAFSLTTPTTSVDLSADNTSAAAPTTVTKSFGFSRTRSRSRSFSFSF